VRVRRPPILAVSGPSGAGKTRLLARLIPALARRGLRVAVVKHTRHDHPFDRPGKDTDVFRRAGAVAAAIEGPSGMAWFGPPAGSLRALARTMPKVDLVLAEGFRGEPVPRVEVHRRSVSREFLCARDRRVLAVVTDEDPPRQLPAFAADDVEPLAALLCTRLGLRGGSRQRRLRPGPGVRSVRPDSRERAVTLGRSDRMARKTSRKGGRASRGASHGGRSAAGRKGGNATLRNRGPEFYSQIGRKGGRSRSRNQALRAARRGAGRGASRTGRRRASRRSR